MSSLYHLRIKQDYALSVIENLVKMDAIEVFTENDESPVPQWQQEEILKRIAHYKEHPEEMMNEDTSSSDPEES